MFGDIYHQESILPTKLVEYKKIILEIGPRLHFKFGIFWLTKIGGKYVHMMLVK
jgi:hypothetical protein